MPWGSAGRFDWEAIHCPQRPEVAGLRGTVPEPWARRVASTGKPFAALSDRGRRVPGGTVPERCPYCVPVEGTSFRLSRGARRVASTGKPFAALSDRGGAFPAARSLSAVLASRLALSLPKRRGDLVSAMPWGSAGRFDREAIRRPQRPASCRAGGCRSGFLWRCRASRRIARRRSSSTRASHRG